MFACLSKVQGDSSPSDVRALRDPKKVVHFPFVQLSSY